VGLEKHRRLTSNRAWAWHGTFWQRQNRAAHDGWHLPCSARRGGTTGGNLVNNPPQSRTFTINTAAGIVGNIDNLVNLTGTALNFPGP